MKIIDPVQDNETIIAAYGAMQYRILKHTSWLARRVEKWEYVGDASWLRSFSLDLDLNQLRIYYVTDYWQKILPVLSDSERNDPEAFCAELPIAYSNIKVEPNTKLDIPFDGFENHTCIIPILELDKCKQFADFNIRDKNGGALHLTMKGVCVQYVLNALIGAIQIEHGEGSPVPLPPLKSTEFLMNFMHDWFSATNPPLNAKGMPIESNSRTCMEDIHEAAIDAIRVKASVDKWEDSSRDDTIQLFEEYFTSSPIFRYFTKTFALKRLVCVEVCLADKTTSIIKCSYSITRNIFGKTVEKSFSDMLFGKLYGIPVEWELDSFGSGEVEHTSIYAPEGTKLLPLAPAKKATEQQAPPQKESPASKKEQKPKLYITDESLTDSWTPKPQANYLPDALASATLTPGQVIVKTKKAWVNDDERPSRRLPVDGAIEHRYILNLLLTPKLGIRALGYAAFLLLSAAVFLMCSLDPKTFLASSGNSTFSIGSILVIAPMAIMMIANREDIPYIRKEIFKFPRLLTAACVVVDILGFFWFFAAGFTRYNATAYSFEEVTWVVNAFKYISPHGYFVGAGIGLLACSILAALFLAWYGMQFIKQHRWQKQQDSYDRFDLPIYEYNPADSAKTARQRLKERVSKKNKPPTPQASEQAPSESFDPDEEQVAI